MKRMFDIDLNTGVPRRRHPQREKKPHRGVGMGFFKDSSLKCLSSPHIVHLVSHKFQQRADTTQSVSFDKGAYRMTPWDYNIIKINYKATRLCKGVKTCPSLPVESSKIPRKL